MFERPASAYLFLLLACPGAASAQAVFTVDSQLDAPDEVPGDGECRTPGNACTLRAALQEVHASAGAPGPFEIRVPPGVYALSHVAGDAADNYGAGDLDLQGPIGASVVRLIGWDGVGPPVAANRPVITAAPGFKRRLMQAVVFADQVVELSDLVFAQARPEAWDASGVVDNGAALRCNSQQSGKLRIERVAFASNEGRAVGTMLSEGCDLQLSDVSFDDNCTLGGVLVSSSPPLPLPRTLRLDRVSFTRNDTACIANPAAQLRALQINGSVAAEPWDIEIANTTFGENRGALGVAAPGAAPSELRTVSLRNVTMHAGMPDFLGYDGLYASGDVTVRAGHATLGSASHATANARVVSAGYLRAAFTTSLAGSFTPHASDLAVPASALLLAPLQGLGSYTLGYPPLDGSPLVDAGAAVASAADDAACSLEDQRSQQRPWGPACDVGAVELVTFRVFASGFE